jgi:hypothetical protein
MKSMIFAHYIAKGSRRKPSELISLQKIAKTGRMNCIFKGLDHDQNPPLFLELAVAN